MRIHSHESSSPLPAFREARNSWGMGKLEGLCEEDTSVLPFITSLYPSIHPIMYCTQYGPGVRLYPRVACEMQNLTLKGLYYLSRCKQENSTVWYREGQSGGYTKEKHLTAVFLRAGFKEEAASNLAPRGCGEASQMRWRQPTMAVS